MPPAGELAVERWPKRGCEPEEQRLVRAVLAGERLAFDSLVRQHSPRVTSVVRGVLRDPNELEDVVQETFLKAYQNLRRFRGESALRTWLIRIAVNVCRDRQGGFWRRRVVLAEDAGLPEAQAPDLHAQSAATALQEAIAREVRQLPEKLREPFVLHAFEELSGAEIAAVLGCNESTVWTRIYAARKRLKQQLADFMDE